MAEFNNPDNVYEILKNCLSADTATLATVNNTYEVLKTVYDPTATALRINVSGMSYYTQAEADANFLSASTSVSDIGGYTTGQADANFLSANTSYYTQAQANANFLSAATIEEKSFQIEFTTGVSYYLTNYAPYGYNINNIYWNTNGAKGSTTYISLSGGSAGSTAIGGLTSISGGTATENYAPTSDYTISPSHKLKLVVDSATSGVTMLYGTIKTTRI